MDKYKKLRFNSIIFAIGNFGSSILSFLMIPLYTAVLSTSQYGTVDFIQTTVMLIAPVAGLSIYEATLRFSMEKNADEKQIVSTSLLSTIVLLFLSIMVLGVLKNQLQIQYFPLFVLLLVVTVLNILVQNYTRATGFIKTYAGSGVLATILLVSSNALLLFIFHFGVVGFLISLIISLLGSIFMNGIISGFFSQISLFKFNYGLLKDMLKYSVPLIPNSVSWWMTSDVNKFFIVFYIGTAANGQFAVASKPGAVLSLVFSIFAKSWQLSATEEINSPDRQEFFSTIFEKIGQLHFVMISAIIVVLEPVFTLLFPKDYASSWTIVPTMLFAVMFANLAAFMGVSYLAGKKTFNILLSTILAGGINIGVNMLLIPKFGLHGAAFGSMFAFLFLFLFRLIDTRRFVVINIKMPQFMSSVFLLVGLSANVIFTQNLFAKILVDLLIVLAELIVNRGILRALLIRRGQ